VRSLLSSGRVRSDRPSRVGVGKHVFLADKRIENANAAAETLANVGYEVSVAAVVRRHRPRRSFTWT